MTSRERGTLGSGILASVVRENTRIVGRVSEDMRMVCLSLPGRPCELLIGMTEAGAEKVLGEIARNLEQLRKLNRSQPPSVRRGGRP